MKFRQKQKLKMLFIKHFKLFKIAREGFERGLALKNIDRKGISYLVIYKCNQSVTRPNFYGDLVFLFFLEI